MGSTSTSEADPFEFASHFYRLGEAFTPRAMRLELVDGLSNEEIAKLSRGELEWNRPLTFGISEGDRLSDFIGTTLSPKIRLVSYRVASLFRACKFRGWRTYEASLLARDKLRAGDDGLYILGITGRSGPIDDALSERVIFPPPVPAGEPTPGLKGWFFDPATWDGSDLFRPEGSDAVVVTERVRDQLAALPTTNVTFERLDQVEQMWDPGLLEDEALDWP